MGNSSIQRKVRAKATGNPGRRGKAILSAGAGIVLAIGAVPAAWADFAPLAPGNAWVYQGEYDAYSGLGPAGRGRERLSLEVLDARRGGDTAYFRIRMRDSVYAREGKSTYSGPLLPLPDTVLEQTRIIASLGDRAVLMPVSRDSGMLLDTTAFRFSGRSFSAFGSVDVLHFHANLPGPPTPVAGADTGLTVVQARHASEDGKLSWEGWYLDGAGAYWERLAMGETASCGSFIARDLRLRKFNGREIAIGVQPPAGPLAKRAKAACSGIRIPEALRAVSLLDEGFRAVDVQGRALSPSALAQWPRATAAWYTLSTPTTKAASR